MNAPTALIILIAFTIVGCLSHLYLPLIDKKGRIESFIERWILK